MKAGMQKPPVAPKPKLTPQQKAMLSPESIRREGFSHLSTAGKIKPLVPPKPSLQKPNLETPRTLGLLTSQNGVQLENKRPSWDYIIPICLCKTENCTCISSPHVDDFKPSQRSKADGNGKTGAAKNKAGDAKSQNNSVYTKTTFSKTLHQMQNGGRSPDSFNPETTGCSFPPLSASNDDGEREAMSQSKAAPVPRKPRRTALAPVSDALPPPAAPPLKKALLWDTSRAPPSLPHPTHDVHEGWDTHVYEMSVDGEDEEIEIKDDNILEVAASHSPHVPPPLFNAPAAEATGRVAPKKPRRHVNNPAAWPEKENTGADWEAKQLNRSHDAISTEMMRRELPSLPTNSSQAPEERKPARSSMSNKKAKSFTSADILMSDGQTKNAFRKFLNMKLRGTKSPKSKMMGDQNQEEQNQDVQQRIGLQRKLSCPSVWDQQTARLGRDVSSEPEESAVYDTICDYDTQLYMNIHVGKTSACPPQTCVQENDEDLYEEQEPYVPLVKKAENDRGSADEEVTAWDDDSWDDEFDSVSISSREDSEHPEDTAKLNEQKKIKIHYIAKEIMSSESVFVDVLKLLHIDFRESVTASDQGGKPVIEERLLNQILYSLPQLYELNSDLLRELQQRVASWDENSRLADVFLKKGPYLKMYSTYIREFDKNVALLEEQTKKNAAFGAVVREFEASPRCANLALKHYLLKPIQRIPQYQLLLTDYLKNLPPDSNDYKDTEAALALVKEVANHANDIMKQGDHFQKLMQVQCRLSGHHELVQPGRIFLKEGVLMKLCRKVRQPRMFFLFNDVLLYTAPTQSGQFKLKNTLSLAGLKVSKPNQEAYQNELNIESVECSFILFASSAAERDEWLQAFSTAITDYTKKKISFIPGKPSEMGEMTDGGDSAPLGSIAPIWIPDPRTTMCMICTCEFTLTWRRHHCRACGKVVCQSCSANKHPLGYLKNEVARVCNKCFLILQKQKSKSAREKPDQAATISPGTKNTFVFNKKKKNIPAALKEVTANTDNSSMSGYLLRSKHKKKQGKRLWFVIKDKVLYTYAASEDVAARKSLPLLGFMLKVDLSDRTRFKLYHKNILHYIFKAEDLQTAERWIISFKEATVL